VLEGVAFSQLECVEVFREMGVPVDDMVVTGGGSKSRLWSQMLADLYGCPVSGMKTDEGAALGAALLAAVGAGVYSSVQEACAAVIKRGDALTPDPAKKQAYEPYFELYKKLYRTMKDDFKALSRL
jgi:xylulokinase